MYHFGLIGCGNMGSAIARAAANVLPSNEMLLANRTPTKAEDLAAELGCNVGSNTDAAEKCDYIFLGVKPQSMADMLLPLQGILRDRDGFVLVSMAAGLSIADIQRMAGGSYPVIRMMPNMPISIGKGMTLLCASSETTPEMLTEFNRILSSSGQLDCISENLFDAAGALSGCGPAYADLFLEALSDGAVSCGVPRQKALEYACQTVIGAASMVLESGKHPAELKDAVCSPGGTTIAGVYALEKGGFRSAAMEAVIAAYEKTVK